MALVSALPAIGPSAAAGAGWSRPFALARPQATDIVPAQLAFSPSGEAAVAFGVQDEDNPASSQAFVALRSPRGRLSAPRRVPGAQEILGLAFDGSPLVLLTGTASAGRSCCDAAAVSRLAGGAFGSSRPLVSKLTGATLGSLTAISPSQLLASVATDRGVWVAQSSAGGPFGATRGLSYGAQVPWALAATSLPSAAATVAWTATTGQPFESAPSQIFAASGSPQGAPRAAHAMVTVPAGHEIDELALAPGRARTTVAWIESWFEPGGAYHFQVVLSDLGAGSGPRTFSVPNQAASGLTLAADQSGDQLIAWRTCNPAASCELQAAVRRGGERFGTPVSLGAIDPYEDPAAAISSRGDALVGWIAGGQVRAALRSRTAGGFGPPRVVSAGGTATDLALAFGPASQALAAWTEEAAAPELLGAVFSSS